MEFQHQAIMVEDDFFSAICAGVESIAIAFGSTDHERYNEELLFVNERSDRFIAIETIFTKAPYVPTTAPGYPHKSIEINATELEQDDFLDKIAKLKGAAQFTISDKNK